MAKDEYAKVDKVERLKKMATDGNPERASIIATDLLFHFLYMNELSQEVIDAVIPRMIDIVIVLQDPKATIEQKMACKVLLKYSFGKKDTERLLEMIAVVVDRRDPLVSKWRKSVLERDKHVCQHCGDTKNLCVHHISYWSDDPVNRVNIDNGITLCKSCHKKEHEDDWFAHFV